MLKVRNEVSDAGVEIMHTCGPSAIQNDQEPTADECILLLLLLRVTQT